MRQPSSSAPRPLPKVRMYRVEEAEGQMKTVVSKCVVQLLLIDLVIDHYQDQESNIYFCKSFACDDIRGLLLANIKTLF